MATKTRGFGAAPGKQKPAKSADDWVHGQATAAAPEPEKTMRLSVDMPASMHMELKLRSVKQGVSMTQLVRDLIREDLGM